MSSSTEVGSVGTASTAFQRRARPQNYIWVALIWIVLLAAPYWLNAIGSYTSLGSRILVFGLAAMGLNFLLGFTGVMSFGHAAYFGLGAYGCGLMLRYVTTSTPLAIVVGTLVGTLGGAVFGALIVRRKGVYFAMLTIAFGQICYYIAYTWNDFTGGYDGLRGFTRTPINFGPLGVLDILSNQVQFYYFVLAIFAVAVGAMALILRSPFGRTLIGIRENQRRMRFLGVPVEQHVWLSFTISTFFTSLAGALYALVNNFADPTTLNYIISGDIVIMAVMGGMRSFWGPLLGAAMFVALQDYISSMTVNWMSFIGLMFVLVVLFFPRGLLGYLRRAAA
ncbi:MAG TPA: branched-chain amino acid ABC transporter permease [Acetobacteraceae bacterium]|nr:branched-chain amino acid ABC transporter permease [Acetobacteraceae bacterium]